MSEVILPHGGELKDLYLQGRELQMERGNAQDYASLDLTSRQLCDIELLLNSAE